jgi:acetylcholinesterase
MFYNYIFFSQLDMEGSGLSVMVWFHGGGFFFGSGNSHKYGPDLLLDRDVILITFNYRLGALGES